MKTSLLNSDSVHVWLDAEHHWIEATWQSIISVEDWDTAHGIMSQVTLEQNLCKYLFDVRMAHFSDELEEEVFVNRTSYLNLYDSGIRYFSAVMRDKSQIEHRVPQLIQLLPKLASVSAFLDERSAKNWLLAQSC